MFLVPEVEWDDTERAWVDALRQYRDGLCPCGCGYPKAVAWAPETEMSVSVDLPIRCHIRTALIKAQKAHGESGTVVAPEALLWGARLRPDGDQPLTG